jgi:hypothetical protein
MLQQTGKGYDFDFIVGDTSDSHIRVLLWSERGAILPSGPVKWTIVMIEIICNDRECNFMAHSSSGIMGLLPFDLNSVTSDGTMD